jgi:hypothetical protein
MDIDLSVIAERIAARAVKDGECLVWTGSKLGKHQYGGLKVGKTMLYVHRLSYMINCGEIPEGMVVMHKCDRPQCLNPDHLRLGTQAENIADMHQKNRNTRLRGERNGRAMLTLQQVLEIRSRYKFYCRKNGSRAMAEEFGVTGATIMNIVNGKTWKSD